MDFSKRMVSMRLSTVALRDAAALKEFWGVSRTAVVERALALAFNSAGCQPAIEGKHTGPPTRERDEYGFIKPLDAREWDERRRAFNRKFENLRRLPTDEERSGFLRLGPEFNP